MNTTKKIYVFLIITALLLICIYAESIIIPFILAILFWFVIRVIKKQLIRLPWLDKMSNGILTFFSTIIFLGLVFFIVSMISKNITTLSQTIPEYEKNISKITESLNDRYNIDIMDIVEDFAKDIKFGNLLSRLLSSLSGLFGNALTILLYLLFLLLEEPLFNQKLAAMYPDKKKKEHIAQLISKIDYSIGNYVALKTFTSLLTGFLSYLALLFIGIETPLFWAFLIFILNFIPTIGSIIATLFPAIFAILQFGEITPGILVLAIVGTVQMIIGNIVEPRVMGNSLNISPLVVFLTLVIWGAIWGVTGMLLSVPITVILMIIMSEFPETRPIALLLSVKGTLND